MFYLAALPLIFAATASTAPPARRAVVYHVPQACAVVTRTEVERALGFLTNGGEGRGGASESACDYEAGRGLVTVSIQRLKVEPALEDVIESLRAAMPEGTIRQAPGMGAPAVFVDIAGAGAQLHVIRGDYVVLVSVLGLGEPAQVSAAAMAIAREAVRRL